MIVKQNLLKNASNLGLEQMNYLYNNYGIIFKIKNNQTYAIMAEIFQEIKTRRIWNLFVAEYGISRWECGSMLVGWYGKLWYHIIPSNTTKIKENMGLECENIGVIIKWI